MAESYDHMKNVIGGTPPEPDKTIPDLLGVVVGTLKPTAENDTESVERKPLADEVAAERVGSAALAGVTIAPSTAEEVPSHEAPSDPHANLGVLGGPGQIGKPIQRQHPGDVGPGTVIGGHQ